MNKIKALVMGFLLSASLIVPVYAVNYSQSTQYFSLVYKDYDSTLQAESKTAAQQESYYAACVYVDTARAFEPNYDCGPLKNNGNQSSKHDQFYEGSYEYHRHCIIDSSLNKSFIK